MRQIILGDHTIDDSSDCFVIAEVGHNHQGSVEKAMQIFDEARRAGANAVKLQKRNNRELYTEEMYNSPYVSESSYGPTYGAHREALEFGWQEYVDLQQYANQLGLHFFATAFDFSSVDFLEKLNVPYYKIASGDLKNTPLLKYVARTGKPVLISTGGAEIPDIQRAYDVITAETPNLAILQCTATYPCEPEEMNLNVITTFRQKFPETVIGLSDHQSGIDMALVAFTLGARIIEKHFTLNRSWKGTDHAFSLAPVGMSKLVRGLRRARVALGSSEKTLSENEVRYLHKMSKKLVAAQDLKKGDVLSAANIAIKSPGGGMPPYELDNIIGLVLTRDLKKDEGITLDHLAKS
jgi:sialic acid synthase